jgi:hypothetical protein
MTEYNSISKKELCEQFGVTRKTLMVWLRKIPGLTLTNQKRFTPKETKMILNHLT